MCVQQHIVQLYLSKAHLYSLWNNIYTMFAETPLIYSRCSHLPIFNIKSTYANCVGKQHTNKLDIIFVFLQIFKYSLFINWNFFFFEMQHVPNFRLYKLNWIPVGFLIHVYIKPYAIHHYSIQLTSLKSVKNEVIFSLYVFVAFSFGQGTNL